MSNGKCRWGLVSTGNIAHRFAHDLALVDDAEIFAVASRTQASADAFGDEFGVPRRYAGYEALAADPDVDIVYIGTPHPMHHDNTLLCLAAGKPVLCEKPLAMSEADAAEMATAARERKLFLMEGLWMAFFPAFRKALELVASGRIGEVRMIEADFGFQIPFNPESRVFKKELGGGALPDVGIYPVAVAQFVFGEEPESIASVAHTGPTGVDERAGMTLRYSGGRLAVLSCSIQCNTTTEARIYGTEGYVRIPRYFFKPQSVVVGSLPDNEAEEIPLPPTGYGFTHEIHDVQACLREGRIESGILPLDTTLAILRTLDRIRACWDAEP